MKTAVVILNWNTRDYLETFLPPLIKSVEGNDAAVIVADSASTDGSIDLVSSKFPEVKTIALDRNYGFTGGYNRAFRQILDRQASVGSAVPEYLVLINSDIKVSPNWLAPLTAWLDAHPECGVCGPKLHALIREGCSAGNGQGCIAGSGQGCSAGGGKCGGYVLSENFEYAGAAGGCLDRYGYPFCRGRVLKRTEPDSGQYDIPKNVLWVSGACMVTRASLWEELGGLDDRFFAHMEEIDFCWRAQLSGYKVTVVPESCVYHLGGGTLPQTSPFKLKLNYRNGLLLLDNNLAATIGEGKAKRRIRERVILDNCSAAVYLLTGKFSLLKAVRDAHREYWALRTAPHSQNVIQPVRNSIRQPEGATFPARNGGVDGLMDIDIVLQSALRGKGIFKYLRRYENCH